MSRSSATLRTSEGTAFFILGDDEGILFSEPQQELHLLDAAACYLWCSVEDGEPVDDIITGYAEACGISQAQATEAVSGLLHRWSGLGYLRGGGLPPPPTIDLTTALGRLLVNPALRHSFAAAPREAARHMGLRDEDRAAFVELDRDQLERQALAVTEKRRQRRQTKLLFDHEATRSLASRILHGKAVRSAPRVERNYRLCGIAFRLRFDSAAQDDAVRPSLLHMEADNASPDIALDVVDAGKGHAVLRDGALVGYCERLDQLARVVIVLVRDLVLDRTDYFLMLHAGVVSNGETCVLLPAAPGSGKSTLTAALAQSGFQYFTDEIAILEEAGLCARPFPIPIVVKEGAVEPLRSYYPALPGMPVCRRDNDQPVRYLPPPLSEPSPHADVSLPVRWIAFPRYEATAETTLTPLRKGDALVRLMGECKVVTADLNRTNVGALVRWLRQVECYDLTVSSLPAAVALMRELCFGPGFGDRLSPDAL